MPTLFKHPLFLVIVFSGLLFAGVFGSQELAKVGGIVSDGQTHFCELKTETCGTQSVDKGCEVYVADASNCSNICVLFAEQMKNNPHSCLYKHAATRKKK